MCGYGFYFLVLLHAAYFCFVFLILFLSFPETNLCNAEKASVKDEGRLLKTVHSSFNALGLYVSKVLNFTNANLPVFYLGLLATTVSLIAK